MLLCPNEICQINKLESLNVALLYHKTYNDLNRQKVRKDRSPMVFYPEKGKDLLLLDSLKPEQLDTEGEIRPHFG